MISYMNSIEYSHEIYYNILIAYHQLTARVHPSSKDSHGSYSMNPMALASHRKAKKGEPSRAAHSWTLVALGGPTFSMPLKHGPQKARHAIGDDDKGCLPRWVVEYSYLFCGSIGQTCSVHLVNFHFPKLGKPRTFDFKKWLDNLSLHTHWSFAGLDLSLSSRNGIPLVRTAI